MAARKTGAAVSRLCVLHELLTEMFIKDIQDAVQGDFPLAASDKNVIVTFLKNNDVTATPDAEGMEALKESLSELTEERRSRVNEVIKAVEDDNYQGLFN